MLEVDIETNTGIGGAYNSMNNIHTKCNINIDKLADEAARSSVINYLNYNMQFDWTFVYERMKAHSKTEADVDIMKPRKKRIR